MKDPNAVSAAATNPQTLQKKAYIGVLGTTQSTSIVYSLSQAGAAVSTLHFLKTFSL
jgi:hypothetical protein